MPQKVAVVALCLLSVAIFAPTAAQVWLKLGTYGVVVSGLTVTRVTPGLPAARAGIRAGDVIVPDSFENRVEAQRTYRHAGDLWTLEVRRGGSVRSIALRAAPVARPLFDRLLELSRLFAYLIFLAVGAALVIARPSIMTWAFFSWCLVAASPFAELWGYYTFLPAVPYFWLQDLTLLVAGVTQFGLLVFAMRFPSGQPSGWRNLVDGAAPFAAVATGLFSATAEYVRLYVVHGAEWMDGLQSAIASLVVVVAIASLIGTYLSATALERQRLAWAIAGASVGFLAMEANSAFYQIADVLHQGGDPNVGRVAYDVMAIAPLAIGYAVLRHRVIDVEFVVNRAIIIGTIAVMLGGIFVSLDFFYTRYITQTRLQMAIDIVVAFAFGWAARSGFPRLVRLIDAMFFHKRYEIARSVERLQRRFESGTAADREKVVVQEAAQTLQLDSAAFLARMPDGGFVRRTAFGWGTGNAWHFLPGDGIVEHLAQVTRRPLRLPSGVWNGLSVPNGNGRSILAVPMGASQNGIVLYGAHADGREIDPDEVRSLVALCAVAARAGMSA